MARRLQVTEATWYRWLNQYGPEKNAEASKRTKELEKENARQFAAADIFTSGRNKVDKGTSMPSDSLMKDFQAATTDYCAIPSMALSDATYAVYTDGKKYCP